MRNILILCGLMLIMNTAFAGERTNNFIPVEGRFGYAIKVKGLVDKSLSEGLLYQNTNGSTSVVWPRLKMIWGKNLVVSNDTALLVGGVARMYPDGKERLTARLIAFKGPTGPPIDITDQVLRRYYAGTGFGLTNFMWDSFVSLIKTNGAIAIPFSSDKIRPGTKDVWEPFDSEITISWREIETMMEDAKREGKMKKEKWSGVKYLEKE